jgi:CRP-like cAMP-binding protein
MLFLRSGEIFGGVAIFAGAPYPGTVLTLEPVELLALKREVALDLLNRYPELAMAAIRRRWRADAPSTGVDTACAGRV